MYKDTEGKILGFSGVAGGNIAMLFVLPEAQAQGQGQGVGTALCRHAILKQSATKIDVYEKNPRAKGLYEKLGFQVETRTETDGEGLPYPTLHMQLRP